MEEEREINQRPKDICRVDVKSLDLTADEVTDGAAMREEITSHTDDPR